MRIVKICLVSAALCLPLAGVALADPPRVVIEPPQIFFPRSEFRYDNDGYYRTHEGRYYHFDKDRDGWHYGRNHNEGQRYEGRHKHDRDRDR